METWFHVTLQGSLYLVSDVTGAAKEKQVRPAQIFQTWDEAKNHLFSSGVTTQALVDAATAIKNEGHALIIVNPDPEDPPFPLKK